jgi:outer membrane immunogenic protein
MKRYFLAAVSVATLSFATLNFPGIANSADLPMKARPLAPVAPAFGWTGCYIGAHVGAGWGTKQWEDTGDDISDNTSYTTNGALGGGQIGCDYQLSSPFVVGVEGSFSGSGIKGSGVQPFEAEQASVSTKINWLATLTGRIGVTADRALIYVKGGGAWVKEKHTTTEHGVGEDEGEVFSQTLSSTRSGWLLGAGIEYAITSNWSAKVEYNYMDFGRKNFLFNELSEDPVSIRQDLHTIKVGVNYRFGFR